MGYIKEPSGIDFMVESKIWSEAEKDEMRKIIAASKSKKSPKINSIITRRPKAKA